MGTVFRGNPDDATCRATIERAIELGVNLFDCANTYQRGRSERLVGQVIQGQRDQLVLTTKVCEPVGDKANDRGLSRVHILREIDNSLSRLGTDYIDVYLLHHPDPTTPIRETLETLHDLVRQGVVRYIGCCNFAAWQVCKAQWVSDRHHLTPITCMQNAYNLLNRSLERDVMPFCKAEGIGIMAYSPLAVGLLTGLFRYGRPAPADTYWGQRPDRFRESMSPDVGHVVEALRRIGKARGKTAVQVAIAWLLSHPEISAVIMGPDSPEQVEENVGATGWELTAEEQITLDEASAWALGVAARWHTR
jgi:aryl-alcohol dehydrogenase-like predicted oxidoreductase